MSSRFGTKQKLLATICIYFCFFSAELAVALKTESLALTADAFHYLNDLIGFTVALTAIIVKDRKVPLGNSYSFGWQRAPIVGAFFNGSFLLALGVSIFFQSVERFIGVHEVEQANLVLVMGDVEDACFVKDNTSVTTEEAYPDSVYRHLHEDHHHTKRPDNVPSGRDLGMVGVMMHVLSDAVNNLGVIAAAAIMEFTDWEKRYIADPAASILISIMILISSLPLIKCSAAILLQGAPSTTAVGDIQEDLEMIPGVESVHELHIWQLDENKTIATAHLIFTDTDVTEFTVRAQIARECLHAYGIHSVTLQPEFLHEDLAQSYRRAQTLAPCQGICSNECGGIRCCTGTGRDICPSTPQPNAVLGSASTLYGVSLDRDQQGSVDDIEMTSRDCTKAEEVGRK
ncbi:hypothetical protein OQA88_12893 [Cercophora sp. LCS_1]